MRTYPILAVLLLTGCGATRVVTRTRLPPRAQALGEAQRLMLTGFTGPRADEARRRIAALIVGGKLHRLVDRGQDGVRLAEQHKQLAQGAVAIEGGTGATALVSAQTQADGYSSKVERFENRKCARRRKKKCIKYVKIPMFRRQESCTASLTGKVIRVADGAVVVQRDFAETRTDSRTKAKAAPAEQRATLCNAAARLAIDRFAGFVTPMETQVALDFHSISDTGDRTEKAIEHARRARFSAARTLLEAAVVDPSLEAEDRAWSRYNLAVVLWALADFQGCVEQLDLAGRALSDEAIHTMRTACSDYLQ